jgi:hypothetical protein
MTIVIIHNSGSTAWAKSITGLLQGEGFKTQAWSAPKAIPASAEYISFVKALQKAAAIVFPSDLTGEMLVLDHAGKQHKMKSGKTLVAFFKKEAATYEKEQASKKIIALGFPVIVDSLAYCVEKGNAEAVKLFFKAGFSPDSRNEKGVGLLHLAARNEQDAMVSLLLASGADVNLSSGDRGASALVDAAMAKDSSLVSILLDAGADPDSKTKDGQSALILSVGLNDQACVELLLKAGAAADEADSLGASARKYAELFNNPEIKGLFNRYAAKAL